MILLGRGGRGFIPLGKLCNPLTKTLLKYKLMENNFHSYVTIKYSAEIWIIMDWHWPT